MNWEVLANDSLEVPITRSALDVEDFAFSLGPSTKPASRPFTENLSGEVFLPVPAGRYPMGGDANMFERPAHWVHCSEFGLARTPVTNRQYGLFLRTTNRPEPWTWRDRNFSASERPVVGVNWKDATAYCDWLTTQSDSRLHFQVPTEAQWEAAARSIEGRIYPWGNESPDSQRACFANDHRSHPGVVGSFPQGAGPFGHLDLAGNVWEWCLDFWERNYEGWRHGEPLDPIGRADFSQRPIRGGGWWSDEHDLRSACRVRRGFPGINSRALRCRPSGTGRGVGWWVLVFDVPFVT